jgi:hypothetical protein
MRLKRMFLVLPALLAMTACMEGDRVIKVNADGSGTIVDTVKLGEQARTMIESMEGADKSTPAEKKAKREAKLRERAAAMGEGVTFVSYEPSVNGGPEKVTYAFKDVTKLNIEATPDAAGAESKPTKEPLTFRLVRKGDASVLTVAGAAPKPGEKKAEDASQGAEVAAQMQAQAMAMMKMMMKGLKMTSVVEVDGKLVKTSSPHVAGSRVTLLQIDFDEVAADEENFKKFAAAGDDPKTMDPAALKGIKGVKFNPEPEITIEFTK